MQGEPRREWQTDMAGERDVPALTPDWRLEDDGGSRRGLRWLRYLADVVVSYIADAGDGASVLPTSYPPHNPRRIWARLQRGKSIRLEVAWKEDTLAPQAARVTLTVRSASLKLPTRQPQPLDSRFLPVGFLDSHALGLSDRQAPAWLRLHGPSGECYLGARPSELALIGRCARWQPPVKRAHSSE
jgi:hypothetical protein